jgi:hypothetical protein
VDELTWESRLEMPEFQPRNKIAFDTRGNVIRDIFDYFDHQSFVCGHHLRAAHAKKIT